MITFWRLAMAPVMRGWARYSRGALDFVPRPPRIGQAHSGGFGPDRILLFGSGVVVGWGVTSHDIGLGGSLAREITRRTGRAVDADIIADTQLSVATAIPALSEVRLARYDAVVIYVGVNDALRLTAISEWRRRIAELADYVTAQSGPAARLFLIGVQPIRSIPTYDNWLGSIADSQASRMNAITREFCSQRDTATYVPISAPVSTVPARFRDSSAYSYWANELADTIAPELRHDQPEHLAGQWETTKGADESDRRHELPAAELTRIDDDTGGRLRQIVEQARTVFDGSGAGLGVFIGDRIVFPIRAGDVPLEVQLSGSFGAATIEARDALIVADAAADARWETNTSVVGELGVRFWGGFPIERVDGERIGLLCVFGHAPRPSRSSWDRTVLRQLALMVQRTLGSD